MPLTKRRRLQRKIKRDRLRKSNDSHDQSLAPFLLTHMRTQEIACGHFDLANFECGRMVQSEMKNFQIILCIYNMFFVLYF